MADRYIMEVINQRTWQTFGGNPVASAVGMASLEVIRDQKLAQNARFLGKFLGPFK